MIFHRVTRYLTKNNIEYRIVREEAMADFIVETRGLVWECTITALEKQKALLVHSLMLESVPSHLNGEMALFLASLNQSLVYGNFELDPAQGEVRFKTYVDGHVSEINSAAIERALILNIKAMKKALPKIRTLLEQPLRLRVRA
jgi:hypothetical protein